MFKFLKDKLKKAVSSFSQKVDEEGEKEEILGEQVDEYAEEEKPKVETPYEGEKEPIKQEQVKEEQVEPGTKEATPVETPQVEEQQGEEQETTEILKEVEDTVEKPATEQSIAEPTLAAVPDAPPSPEETPKEEGKEQSPPDEIEEIIHQTDAPPEKKETPTEPLLHTEKKPELETSEPEPIKEVESEIKKELKSELEETKEEEKPKKGFFTSLTKHFHKEKVDETPKPLEGEPAAEKTVEEEAEEENKGLFSSIKKRITTTKINEKQFEDLFSDLEMAMLENNVAIEVIEKVKEDLKASLVDQPIRRTKVEQIVVDSLKDSIRGLFMNTFDLTQKIKEKEETPFVIAFVGINGSGKTTSIAKLTSLLRQQGFEVVIAAADTFRAASIEQLTLHGNRLGVKVIKHDYGSDPAAVAFDAIKHAKSKSADVVLIDTAGRMHKNANLMDEMKKIVRVAKPDLKIFVGESITGNDCIEQAKSFNEAVEIDGIILSKADIDEKGGAAVSVSYITQKPVLYLGVGQDYQDLQPFNHSIVMENLGLA